MKRTDKLNYITIDGVSVCRGHSIPFGATILEDGAINFSLTQ